MMYHSIPPAECVFALPIQIISRICVIAQSENTCWRFGEPMYEELGRSIYGIRGGWVGFDRNLWDLYQNAVPSLVHQPGFINITGICGVHHLR